MQRGSVLPFLLILGLILAIGVGVFFLKFQTDLTSDASVSIAPKIFASPAPQIQTISDQLTGLSFEVPPGFSLKRESEEEYFKRAFGNIRKNFNYYILYNPAEFAEAFYVVPEGETNLDKAILTAWVFKNPENFTPEKFYEKYWYYPFVWGDFSSEKNKIAPESIELIGGKEGQYGVVDYRDGDPKFIYLPLNEKDLMMQIHLPTQGNPTGEQTLKSFKFQ